MLKTPFDALVCCQWKDEARFAPYAIKITTIAIINNMILTTMLPLMDRNHHFPSHLSKQLILIDLIFRRLFGTMRSATVITSFHEEEAGWT